MELGTDVLLINCRSQIYSEENTISRNMRFYKLSQLLCHTGCTQRHRKFVQHCTVKFSVIGLDSTGFNENDQSRNSRSRITSANKIFLFGQSRQIELTDSHTPLSNGPHQIHFHYRLNLYYHNAIIKFRSNSIFLK